MSRYARKTYKERMGLSILTFKVLAYSSKMAAKTVTSTIVNDKKNLFCYNPIPNNGEQILRDTKQVTILYRKKTPV